MSGTATVAASTSRTRLGGLPMLDGLRAVAAGMVLLTHTGFDSGEVAHGVHGAVLARFDFGVAIFFVLSGFLLYRPFAEAQLAGNASPSVRRYFVRRALRILPAYWLALAAALAASSHTNVQQAMSHVALLQVYFAGLLPDFSQTWSLSTEVAFYLALPLLALALSSRIRPGDARRFLRVHLGALGAATAGCWVFMGIVSSSGDPSVRRMNTWLPAHLDWFAVGMALAAIWAVGHGPAGTRLSETARSIAAYPGTCLLAAGVVFWLAATPLGGPRTLSLAPAWEAVAKEVLYTVCAGCLVLVAAFGDQRAGPLPRVLASPSARYLGRISYAVFLWHVLVLQEVYSVTGWRLFTGHFLGVSFLTTVATLVVASVSWRVLERPLLERGSKRRSEKAPSRGATQQAEAITAPAQNS